MYIIWNMCLFNSNLVFKLFIFNYETAHYNLFSCGWIRIQFSMIAALCIVCKRNLVDCFENFVHGVFYVEKHKNQLMTEVWYWYFYLRFEAIWPPLRGLFESLPLSRYFKCVYFNVSWKILLTIISQFMVSSRKTYFLFQNFISFNELFRFLFSRQNRFCFYRIFLSVNIILKMKE